MNIFLLILLVILVLMFGPMLFLWSINSLSELGGVKFYIEHSLHSYFVSIVFMAVMKATFSHNE